MKDDGDGAGGIKKIVAGDQPEQRHCAGKPEVFDVCKQLVKRGM